LFLGFVEAGVPLGVTFSFLIAAPMINEVALVLLVGLFGWKVAIIYMVTGLTIAILSGWLIGKLGLEKYVAEWVYKVKVNHESQLAVKLSFYERIQAGYESVKEIVGKIWIYIIIGIAVGAGAHGYVPEDFLGSLLGKENWYGVPLAILMGIPMYSNAAGIIPIVSVLIEKGRFIRNCFSIYDVGDCLISTRNYYPEKSIEMAINHCICWDCCHWNCNCWVHFKLCDVMSRRIILTVLVVHIWNFNTSLMKSEVQKSLLTEVGQLLLGK